MSKFFGTIFRGIGMFLSSAICRRLLYIGILVAVTIMNFFSIGLARRTFVFYNVDDGSMVVEDRMLKYASSREDDLIRYTEEILLGPASPNLLPLFPRGTGLNSLLFRDGVVYVNFTSSAVLPPMEGGNTFDNFRTYYSGILRNFPYVRDIRFFIEGSAAYTEVLWQEVIQDDFSFFVR